MSEYIGTEQTTYGSLTTPGTMGYVQGCIREVENAYYGRQTRRPIHDAIVGLATAVSSINAWYEGIGLVVQNGKLCVSYDPQATVSVTNQVSVVIPTNIQEALNDILTEVGGTDVRNAIATALGWAYSGTISIEELGLIVENGLLCYTTDSVIPGGTVNVSSLLADIVGAEYGRDVRAAIVKALRLGTEKFSAIAQYIEDLGLTVQDGKLCNEFEESGLLPN